MHTSGPAQSEPALRQVAALPPALLPPILGLIGFSAVVAQVVLMRELLVVFQGNEISLGLSLAAWLFWTAVGAHVLGRWAATVRRPAILTAGLQVGVAVALPAAMVAVRSTRLVLRALPGEILGPGPMLAVSLVTLGIFCAGSGLLFAAGSRLVLDSRHAAAAAATSTVYLWEAVGSAAGGLSASLLLIPRLTPFGIAGLLAVLNLAAASLVAGGRFRVGAFAGVIAVGLPLSHAVSRRLETAAQGLLWRGFEVLESRNTVFGNLVVTAAEDTRTLFENGLVLCTIPDRAAAEEAVHYAMLQHPAPSAVLLIGGGVDGSVAEILQHPAVRRVDYVELDPEILRLAAERLGGGWPRVRSDPRVQIHLVDGRRYVKIGTEQYDVVIVHLPDPQTAQLNRFYTLEFFREARERLKPGGILSLQVTGAEDYVGPELGKFLRCIGATLRGVFAEVAIMPGGTIHFFAGSRAGSLTLDPAPLLARIRERGLRTQYVREYYLPFRLSAERVRDLASLAEPDSATRINSDFSPIAYYFNVALWGGQFYPGYRHWFGIVSGLPYAAFAGCVVIGLFAVVMALRFSRRHAEETDPRRFRRRTAGFCVVLAGFTGMSLEVLLLFTFQAVYGYVFQQLALLIAAFMAGMALGSRRGSQPARAAGDSRRLAWLQVWTAAAPVLLYGAVWALSRVKGGIGLSLAGQLGFPLLAALSGYVGGCQFAVASQVYFRDGRHAGRSLGSLYGLDLAGACAGAVLISAFLMPLYGFSRTALLVTTANMAPVALAVWGDSHLDCPPRRRIAGQW